MTTPDPTFNGTALSDANFTVGGSRVVYSYPARSSKSSSQDAGSTPEVSLGPTRIFLSGTITNSGGLASSFGDFGDLLKIFRGSGAGMKRGQLDVFGSGRHWLAQIVGTPTFTPLRGELGASVELEFVADDPFQRVSYVTVTATPAPTMTIASVTDFSGDAPQMPCVINMGSGWSSGNVIQIYNQTSGVRFGYVCSSSITASDEVIFNSETGEILEGVRVSFGGAVSGRIPYIVGGDDNVLDFTGSTSLVSTTVEFWDRVW